MISMKKRAAYRALCLTWALAVLLPAAGGHAMAASKDTRKYSLPLKGTTVLQNTPDRGIRPVTEVVRHEKIAGESPTTGLPWEGDYLPMLVQIGTNVDSVKVKGSTVKSMGIGKSAPWGGQFADIVYEGILSGYSFTRFSFLFNDSFEKGEPQKGVGPVRSTRIGPLLLREEWQSGYVYGGGFAGTFGWEDHQTLALLRQSGAESQGVLFDLRRSDLAGLAYRVEGVKAPSNLNADIIAIRSLIPASHTPLPRPFLFADENPYTGGYAAAQTVHLDWGAKESVSHFRYDENSRLYLRFCGPGMNETKWTPSMTFSAVDDRSAENQRQLCFANLIIQRVNYEYILNNWLVPDMRSIGRGNADIFTGGRYVPGYWVRGDIADPTVFYDDRGQEIKLARGKTFIAHFPPESLCTFTAE